MAFRWEFINISYGFQNYSYLYRSIIESTLHEHYMQRSKLYKLNCKVFVGILKVLKHKWLRSPF